MSHATALNALIRWATPSGKKNARTSTDNGWRARKKMTDRTEERLSIAAVVLLMLLMGTAALLAN